MLESIGGWFGGWLLSPWLFVLGALLMASPILIHLWNRRRFVTVDWAAMDFLLEANRRNRRRVRMENLLLLLLRCLAMLLIGLLLARPFSCSFAPQLIESQRFERIVLLDDSLSMQVVSGNESLMEKAKAELKELVRSLADNDTEDSLTLLLASHPQEKILNAAPIQSGDEAVLKLMKVIDNLEATDQTAQLESALHEVESLVVGDSPNVNRVVYLLSDMRRRDWRPAEPAGENHPATLLKRIAEQASACLVIDMGAGDDASGNVVVSQITTESTLAEGVSSQFLVSVTNPSDTTVRDVQVEFTAGEALPLVELIPQIGPGKTETAPFQFKLTPDRSAADASLPSDANDASLAPQSVRIRAAASTAALGADRLAADSERFFAARIVAGLPVLIVDGAPASIPERSESFYLRRALAPPGNLLSGIAVDTVTDTEFETTRLNRYSVVFLCNLYRLTPQRVASLRQWVVAGGGLAILPGDQVDQQDFNQHFAQGEQPLSPLRLLQLAGDETKATWANFNIADQSHPALRVFTGQNNPFLDRVKLFQWWQAERTHTPESSGEESNEQASSQKEATVLAQLNTGEASAPAIAEHAYGRGRVAALVVPADVDWTNWPDDPSYLIAMQELAKHLALEQNQSADLTVGEAMRLPLDLTELQRTGTVINPSGVRTNVQARERNVEPANEPGTSTAEDSAPPTGRSTVWEIDFDETSKRGFYELRLQRNQGGEETRLFAANVDPSEGDLRRVDRRTQQEQLSHPKLSLVGAGEAAMETVSGQRSEWWRWILLLLIGMLFAEQGLAWAFGRRR